MNLLNLIKHFLNFKQNITKKKSEISTQATQDNDLSKKEVETKEEPQRLQFVLRNVVVMVYLHLAAFYGLYLLLSLQTKLSTVIFGK